MKILRILLVFAVALLAGLAAHAQQRAPLPLVKGTIATQNLASTGDCTAGSCVCADISTVGAISVQTLNAFTATGGLSARVSNDWTNWVQLTDATTFRRMSNNASAATIASGQVDIHQVSGLVTGARAFCVVATGAVSGPASIIISAAEPSIGSASGGGGGTSDATAANQVTQINSLASIDTKTPSLVSGRQPVDGSGVTQPISAAALPLPSGAATSANQSSELTKLDTLHSDITASNTQLPSALGQTTASGSLSVVQASDQTSIVGQGSATSGQKGNLTQGAVTTSSPSYTNGQTSPLSLDTSGSLRVNVVSGSSSGTVTQGSTTSGQSGMLTQGAVTTAAPSYTNAQTSPISLTTAGSLRVIDTAISATANADSSRLPVSLDIASPVSGTANSAAVLTNMPFAVGKGAQSITVTITSISSATVQYEYSPDGTDTYKTVNCWDATNTGSSGSVASSTTVRVVICPVLGTHFQVRQTTTGSSAATVIPNAAPSPKAIATVTVASSNQLPVLGAGAHDSAIVGAPVRVGCRGRTSYYATTIANDDTVDVQCDLNGAAITKPYSVSGSDWTTTVNLTDTTSTALKASAGASLKNYVTWCSFSGISTTVATQIKILDNATLKYPFNMKAGGGDFHVTFPTPIQGSAATAMNVQLSGSPTGAIDVTCGGYQGQ